MSIRHCYIHIPYCASKCPYCDFNSIAGRSDEWTVYVQALLQELRRLPTGPYDTLFMGGGTPTILPPELLSTLLSGIRSHIDLSDDYEWTCEANPSSADAERFKVLAEHGVNRVSVGVQSTDDATLSFLGRAHNAAEAHHTLAEATAQFERVSADIMFGLPQQTAEDLKRDLNLYKQHGITHASVYHLTMELGTEFHARYKHGEQLNCSEQQSGELFDCLMTELATMGFHQYETSNFAHSGAECRHNIAYWTGQNYHAVGAGAVSTIHGQRCTRHKHPKQYINSITAGQNAIQHTETISDIDRINETWMLGFRLQRGVCIQHLEQLGITQDCWQQQAGALQTDGLIDFNNTHIWITRAGRAVQDAITQQFFLDTED